jgi:hypothetical protein
MNTRCGFLRSGPWITAALLFAALASSPRTAEGADAPAVQAVNQTPADSGWGTSPSSASPWTRTVLAESWWERMLHPIETGLTTRTRMLQFGALMMLLALWVIWWRK